VERKLTAILCADVHGYSRLMEENEEATLRTLRSYRKLIDSLIEQHYGRFVNSAGDSVLAEFASVVNAVQCAVEIQTTLKSENANLPPGRRMEFRIGINLGDVIVEGEQIYGDGVNVAAGEYQEYFSDGITDDFDHRALQTPGPVRNRTHFRLHVQRQGGKSAGDQQAIGGKVRIEGERTQSRQPSAHHRSVGGCDHR
jgi:adenylate cyclase